MYHWSSKKFQKDQTYFTSNRDHFATCTYGIADVAQANTISVYPNPANNNLFIDANNFGGTITSIAITNMQGQTMVADYNVTNTISNISLQGLQSGVYMVQIQTSEGTVIKKVIKQ